MYVLACHPFFLFVIANPEGAATEGAADAAVAVAAKGTTAEGAGEAAGAAEGVTIATAPSVPLTAVTVPEEREVKLLLATVRALAAATGAVAAAEATG